MSCVPRQDLCVYQGDDKAWLVTVTLDDGTPADIAGYTAMAQIRLGPADSGQPVVTSFTCAVVSPAVSLSLSHDQTELLKGRYKWDLQLTSPAGIITTILQGNVSVTAEVTRQVLPLRGALVTAVSQIAAYMERHD